MLIIRNLNLISVQSWTYLNELLASELKKVGVTDFVSEIKCVES